VIFLDTSLLIDSLTGLKRSGQLLMETFDRGEGMLLSTITLCEWLRGPRTHAELVLQQNLFPSESIVSFHAEEAAIAARLYRSVPRARGREIDLMIAASAIRHEAELWTLNIADFKDIPGLRLLKLR
jgi:predicted nucleic acid-binding protein